MRLGAKPRAFIVCVKHDVNGTSTFLTLLYEGIEIDKSSVIIAKEVDGGVV